jgi:transcriptional regulator with XRE-family HTH domain
MKRMFLDTNLSTKVRMGLVQRGLKLKALAHQLGVSRLTLWRILSGRRPVRAQERRAIAAALQIEPNELFGRLRNPRLARQEGGVRTPKNKSARTAFAARRRAERKST